MVGVRRQVCGVLVSRQQWLGVRAMRPRPLSPSSLATSHSPALTPARSSGAAASPSASSGRCRMKAAPLPGSLSTSAQPPCSSTSALTRARPTPGPPRSRLDEPVEDVGLEVIGDAAPGVLDPDAHLRRRWPRRDRVTAPPSDIDARGVVQQVVQRLADALRVGADRPQVRRGQSTVRVAPRPSIRGRALLGGLGQQVARPARRRASAPSRRRRSGPCRARRRSSRPAGWRRRGWRPACWRLRSGRSPMVSSSSE